MNEYLENPNRISDGELLQTKCLGYSVTDQGYYIETHHRNGSKSRGKREKMINYHVKSLANEPNMILSKKRIVNNHGPHVKKMSFKSFDQRRALTKTDHRDEGFDEPSNYLYANPLRSSSACHKKSFSNERSSSPRKNKSTKGGKVATLIVLVKPSSTRQKKIKQRSQMSALKRVSATQAMINLIKSCKNKQ